MYIIRIVDVCIYNVFICIYLYIHIICASLLIHRFPLQTCHRKKKQLLTETQKPEPRMPPFTTILIARFGISLTVWHLRGRAHSEHGRGQRVRQHGRVAGSLLTYSFLVSEPLMLQAMTPVIP